MALILNILPNLKGGGAETVAINLTHDWVSRNFDVCLVLMKNEGDFLSKVSNTVDIVGLDVERIRDVPLALSRVFKEKRPDATLVHMWPLTSVTVLAWLIAGRPGRLILCEHVGFTEHVLHHRQYLNILYRVFASLTHRFASEVVAVSKGVAFDIARNIWIRDDRVTVIYNPVVDSIAPPELTHSEKTRKALWGGSFKYHLIAIGNLKKQKNYQMLLEAFAEVSSHLDVGLVILGEGLERKSLEEKVYRLSLQGRVRFPGFDPHPSRWLKTADALVLSSDYEGLPTVLIEALAVGKPVVSTSCPHGPSEIVVEQCHGRLTAVGDVWGLANAIRETLLRKWDPALLQKRALDFSIENKSNEYLELFRL